MNVIMYCIKISRAFPQDTVTRHWVGLRVRKARVCQLSNETLPSSRVNFLSRRWTSRRDSYSFSHVWLVLLCFDVAQLLRVSLMYVCRVQSRGFELRPLPDTFYPYLVLHQFTLMLPIVLHTGSIEMGMSRKRPATKNNYTDFSDSRNILPLQSSLGASRLGQEVAHPEHDLKR